MTGADAIGCWEPDRGQQIDVVRTLALHGVGPRDPTVRLAADGVWLALRLHTGDATLHLGDAQARQGVTDRPVALEAWGPGAGEALAVAPALLGAHDDPTALDGTPLVGDAARRRPGVRFGRYPTVVDVAVPVVLEQRVVTADAQESFRRLVWRVGRRAPGPARLWMRPDPGALLELGYAGLHPLGVERRRAEVVRTVARKAPRLEATGTERAPCARAVLESLPGVGPWTSATVTQRTHGDPDAVVVGDLHLPGLVGAALAGEPDADDARMLDLLEPYRPQRARAVRLLLLGGATRRARRRAPRRPSPAAQPWW